MLEFFIFLFLFENCAHKLFSSIGAQFYSITTNDDDLVCINITTYPFFIIFNEFNNDVIYQQYSSPSNDINLDKKSESLLRFLPVFKMFESPYAFIVLKTPIGGNISFTMASYPGMCQNGMYLSNRMEDNIAFPQSDSLPGAQKFFTLNEYDDKCILYSTPFSDFSSNSSNLRQHIKIELQSKNCDSQVFIYSSFKDFNSISGNATIEQTTNEPPIITNYHNDKTTTAKGVYKLNNETSNSPFIIRIVASEKVPPTLVNISFIVESESDENQTSNQLLDWNEDRSGIYLPAQKIEKCPEEHHWYSLNLAISMIIVTVLTFFALLFVISSQRLGNFGHVHNDSDYQPQSVASDMHFSNETTQMFSQHHQVPAITTPTGLYS